MEWYHFSLLSLALIALLLSWRVPRCGKWIFLASASYVVSVVYHRMSVDYGIMPHGSVLAFFCDAIVFIIIRQLHEDKWEIYGLGGVVMLMVVFNLVQVMAVSFGFPPVMDKTIYSAILECANAAYLLMICGVGLMDWLENGNHEGHDLGWHRPDSVGSNLTSISSSIREKSQVRKLSL